MCLTRTLRSTHLSCILALHCTLTCLLTSHPFVFLPPCRAVLCCAMLPQVIIVDEFTGRTMPGRRWSEGLHQAVEAKEALDIQAESVTLASVSYQAFFRWGLRGCNSLQARRGDAGE